VKSLRRPSKRNNCGILLATKGERIAHGGVYGARDAAGGYPQWGVFNQKKKLKGGECSRRGEKDAEKGRKKE